MLSPYRVLDLTNERGLLCGQILGDLGADVVQIEPPGGSSARALGPYYNDVKHPDRSLYWWAYCRNKRSITLNLAGDEGREMLRRMIPTAHFMIESEQPGEMARLGLSYGEVYKINPGLVYVSISGFGQDGPKANYAETDLILLASGGPLAITGDDDRPPVRLRVPQAWLHACAEAAVGAMVAHHERQLSGVGQQVDVSAQQAVALATQAGVLAAPLESPELRRMAGGVKVGPLNVRLLWPASDGYVTITFLFGSALGPFSRRLFDYIYDNGGCDRATRDKDWIGFGDRLQSGAEPIAEYERLKLVIEDFTKQRTKAELMAAAEKHGLLIAPVTTLAEVRESAQLAAREYWRPVNHPELGRAFDYPGPFAKFSESPLAYRRRPPTVGEHNREVYAGELGLTDSELAALTRRGVI